MCNPQRSRDPSRPLMYEGGGARSRVTDIVCPMYATPAQIVGQFILILTLYTLSCLDLLSFPVTNF